MLNPFTCRNKIGVCFNVSNEVMRKLKYYKSIEPDYMQGPNPDGPANHTDSNISAARYSNDGKRTTRERENNDK
jgi:hypothetical protein